MTIGRKNSKLSSSKELLSKPDIATELPQDGVIKRTKNKLANLTTGFSTLALAGTLMGTPAMAEYKPVYEPLASNEIMLVEKMTESRFLATAGLRGKDIAEFTKLGDSEKQAIFDYYSLGISKGLNSAKLRGVAIQLVIFFSGVKNNLDYINGKINGNEVNWFPISLTGKNIDKILGTSLGDRGEEVDKNIGKFVKKGLRQEQEELRKLKILLEALKQVK